MIEIYNRESTKHRVFEIMGVGEFTQGLCRMNREEDQRQSLDIPAFKRLAMEEKVVKKSKCCPRSQERKNYQEKGSGQKDLMHLRGQVG